MGLWYDLRRAFEFCSVSLNLVVADNVLINFESQPLLLPIHFSQSFPLAGSEVLVRTLLPKA